jgi:hypothetical protein
MSFLNPIRPILQEVKATAQVGVEATAALKEATIVSKEATIVSLESTTQVVDKTAEVVGRVKESTNQCSLL